MGKIVIPCLLLTAGIFLVSCAGQGPSPTQAPARPPISSAATSAQASDAARLFAANCAVCHGEKRQGVSGLGPALTPETLAKLSDAEVTGTVLRGRPGTSMAGFEGRLNPEEAGALVQLIKRTTP